MLLRMETIAQTPTSESGSSQEAPVRITSAAHKFSEAPAVEKTAVLVNWLAESKARDIVALHVAGQSQCTDVIIIVTASSLRHAKSLADGLLAKCSEHKYEYLRMEGYQAGQWILADLNDIVVHIFQQEMRELFRIEALWKQAPVLYGTPAAQGGTPEAAKDAASS